MLELRRTDYCGGGGKRMQKDCEGHWSSKRNRYPPPRGGPPHRYLRWRGVFGGDIRLALVCWVTSTRLRSDPWTLRGLGDGSSRRCLVPKLEILEWYMEHPVWVQVFYVYHSHTIHVVTYIGVTNGVYKYFMTCTSTFKGVTNGSPYTT